MKKKREGQKNSITAWIIASVVLFGYFLIVLMSYSHNMKADAQKQVSLNLADSTQGTAALLSAELAKVDQADRTTAAVLGLEDSDVLSSRSREILKNAMETVTVDYGYLCGPDGVSVDVDGKELNVWSDRCFAAAMTGSPAMSDIRKNPETGFYEIAFYAPIIKNDVVQGAACMVFNTQRFGDFVVSSEHDGQTWYCLMTEQGEMIGLTGLKCPAEGSILYDLIRDGDEAASVTTGKLRQYLENGKAGQFSANVNNVERYITFSPVDNRTWFVSQIYTADYFDRLVNRSYKTTKSVIFKLMIALFLFFATVVLISILNKLIYNKQSKELQSQAETDLLTGLLNKIATQQHIQEYLDGEGRNRVSMLFVVDVDNFKKINDTMGHAFGDQVLATLGVRLKNEFRVSDIVGRIGGDEFIVFLKDTKDDSVRRKEARKLLNFFQNFQTGEYVKYSSTASIGVAMYPQDGSDFEELYKAADKGVYRAKQRGKNQLSFYNEEDDKNY